MRTDVKLGVAFSMAIVLVAGVYYFYRDTGTQPISLADRPAAGPDRLAKGDKAPATERNKPAVRPAKTKRPDTDPSALARRSPTRPDTQRATPERTASSDAMPIRPKGEKISQPVRDAEANAETLARGSEERPRPNVPITPETGSERRGGPGDDSSASREIVTRRRDARPIAPSDRGTRSLTATGPGGSTVPGRTGSSLPAGDAAVDHHYVQPGDTFAALAQTYYGSERFTDFLIQNNPQITDPRRLRVGARIRIPPAPADARAALSASEPRGTAPIVATPSNTRTGQTYRVKPGDSFYAIARDVLGDASRWKELLAMNHEVVNGDPLQLRPGQTLALPPK